MLEVFDVIAPLEGRKLIPCLAVSCARVRGRPELTLLAVLAPVIVSNVATPFSEDMCCPDASLEKGAVCSAPAGVDISSVLWMTADKKGFYTRLDDRPGGWPESRASLGHVGQPSV